MLWTQFGGFMGQVASHFASRLMALLCRPVWVAFFSRKLCVSVKFCMHSLFIKSIMLPWVKPQHQLTKIVTTLMMFNRKDQQKSIPWSRIILFLFPLFFLFWNFRIFSHSRNCVSLGLSAFSEVLAYHCFVVRCMERKLGHIYLHQISFTSKALDWRKELKQCKQMI